VATIAVHVPMVLGSRDQRTESSPDVETWAVTSNPTWRWDLYNGLRIALLSVDEIRELERISNEETVWSVRSQLPSSV